MAWLDSAVDLLSGMSWLEAAGALTGLLCVWLTTRQSLWCWPTGILNAALFLVLFMEVRLYADAGLQVVYVALSVYGWWRWLHPGEQRAELPVTRITPRLAALLGTLTVTTAAVMGAALVRWTDASLPYWDATTTALSLTAQYLLARKVLESWALWIAVDVLSVGVYLAKDLALTAGLYVIFLCLAARGLYAWRRSMGGVASLARRTS